MSNNYITRCQRRLGSVGVRVAVLVGDKVPEWEPAPDRWLGPSGPTVELPSQNAKEVLLWSEKLWVTMCQSIPVSNSPLTHNQHQPFRIKCERYIFYKEAYWFVHLSSSLCSAYICICIRILVRGYTTLVLWFRSLVTPLLIHVYLMQLVSPSPSYNLDFLVLWRGLVTYLSSPFFLFLPCGTPWQQSTQFDRFSFFFDYY